MKAKVPANAYKADIFPVKLAINQLPKTSIDKNKGIVKWGNKNDYPNRLLFWFTNDAEHGAICKGKARYLSGSSIIPDPNVPQSEEWLKYANPKESWYELGKKLDLDKVLCGGYYVRVISNAMGVPIHFYHLDFAKCRMSDCMKYVLYSDNWDDSLCVPVKLPVWDKNTYGTSVFIYKSYSPTGKKLDGAYPQPEYLSCTLDIDTDVRISTFGNSIVSKGFSLGHIITIFNGEKDKTAQKATIDKIKGNQQGEENAGDVAVIFTDVNGKPTEITSIPTSELDKQYEVISKRNQQKKLTGHNVSGVLFKIKTEGQLGNRTELIEAHELFLNEYVKIEQEPRLQMMSMFYKLKHGIDVKFEIEQVQPIGLELPIDNQNVVTALNSKSPEILVNTLVEKYGLVLPDTTSSQVLQGDLNSNLKGLSGRENQDMLRIARQYDKGQMTRQQAILRLTSGYGLTEDQASKFLNENDEIPSSEVKQCSHVHFSADKNVKFFELFNKYAHDINYNDEVLEVKFIDGKVKLADEVKVDRETLDNVLVAVKGNPEATPETISKDLKLPLELVSSAIASLLTYKLIESLGKGFLPTQKGLDWEVESEIYTEYVYAKRPDVTGPTVIPTTREFCRDLVQLTKKKALSYEAINKLENEFGENAWDYRGGFYNDGQETTPFCRHIWKAVTKIKRK